MRRRRRIRIPASSANLGPGFDVLAAALAMHIEVEVVETGHFAVLTDLSIARDRRNLVVRGFAASDERSATWWSCAPPERRGASSKWPASPTCSRCLTHARTRPRRFSPRSEPVCLQPVPGSTSLP